MLSSGPGHLNCRRKKDFTDNVLFVDKVQTEILYTVELQWLKHLKNHRNTFETVVVRVNECYSLRKVMRHNRDIFSIFFTMEVCCVFSLESPH